MISLSSLCWMFVPLIKHSGLLSTVFSVGLIISIVGNAACGADSGATFRHSPLLYSFGYYYHGSNQLPIAIFSLLFLPPFLCWSKRPNEGLKKDKFQFPRIKCRGLDGDASENERDERETDSGMRNKWFRGGRQMNTMEWDERRRRMSRWSRNKRDG